MILLLTMRPTGKARPRERGRLPTEYRQWKKHAATLLQMQLLQGRWPKATDPHRHAVRVSAVAYHSRPKSPPAWMTKEERAAFRSGWSPARLATPDADNLIGAILDSLTDSQCCWVDDTQAILGSVSSTWAAAGKDPHIVVTLERLDWEL
tara:strand:+ start:1658 stop:2107 length:450 start_codon:yes stop_codon:yes gene_type:complete